MAVCACRMKSIHAQCRTRDFPRVFRGMQLGHPPCVRDIRDLVEELPECESKGALRGLATAARIVDDGERQQILERMAAVVRRWKESDPVAVLDAELGRRLRNSAVRP